MSLGRKFSGLAPSRTAQTGIPARSSLRCENVWIVSGSA
jgi:hypothetical protein